MKTKTNQLIFCVAVVSLQVFNSCNKDESSIETPEWTKAKLSEGRFALAATSVGDKALFAGGEIAGMYSNVVDIYDDSNGKWTVATLSEQRTRLAAASADNKAFFAGGYNVNDKTSDRVDIFDNSTGKWSTAFLSQKRGELAATSVGTKVLFAGGVSAITWVENENPYLITSYITTSDVVDIYDTKTNSWSTAKLSQPRCRLVAVSVGNKAFFAGGLVSFDGALPPWSSEMPLVSDVVDIYDYDTNTWTTAKLSEERWGMAATSIGTKAMFAGGSSTGSSSKTVDIYDHSTNSWSTATLIVPREWLAAASVGDKALFVEGKGYPVVDIYDNTTNNWTFIEEGHENARYLLAATSVGSKVFFAGGTAYECGYCDIVILFTFITTKINH